MKGFRFRLEKDKHIYMYFFNIRVFATFILCMIYYSMQQSESYIFIFYTYYIFTTLLWRKINKSIWQLMI